MLSPSSRALARELVLSLLLLGCGVAGPGGESGPEASDPADPTGGTVSSASSSASGAGGGAGGSGTTSTASGAQTGTGGQGGQGAGGGSTATSSGSGAGGASNAQVDWLSWPVQQARMNTTWGTALTDIANHLPKSYGTTYDDPDVCTFGHETSHGIHAHLRNYKNTTGKKANAFYVLADKAALVIEPNMYKSEMASYVPQSLRGFRYGTYITGQTAWDDTPLYVWDEWNAYVNGAEVGVNRVKEGLWKEGWRDQSGNLEFVVYAMALAQAVADKDPGYFSTYKQFREFLMWNTERAMALFHEHQNMPEFTSSDVGAYHQTFKTSADAEALRKFIRDTFGASWTMQILGF
jgi:hypothetical protein